MVSIERKPSGVQIHIASPGLTLVLFERVLLYAVVVVFAIFALVGSGFGLIAWIATVPFALMGGRLLYLMILYSRIRIDIDIDRIQFVIRARGPSSPWRKSRRNRPEHLIKIDG